jgi:uncharacterized protein (TIGR02646 family)
MIRIHKPKKPPKRLNEKGKPKTRGMKSAYTRNPVAYDGGERKYKFDSGIYGHKSVKEILVTAQHGKCCFCESKVKPTAHGDVEHFRPKGRYQQTANEPLRRPGYYWLAYDWSNLLFSCQICNQTHKKNLFPLIEPENRAINHHHGTGKEAPVLIHPEQDEPEDHITFRAEFAFDKTNRGKGTIEVLGLNRPDLVEARRKALHLWQMLKSVLKSDSAGLEIEGIEELVRSKQQPDAQYSAMFRAYLND